MSTVVDRAVIIETGVPMTVLYIAAGAALALLMLDDAFESVVLPRRVTRPYRFARLFYRAAWR
jgi:hypothetical protein